MNTRYKFAFSLLLLAATALSRLQAASLNVLYNFPASNNGGSFPYGSLVQGGDGNFYGMTSSGGTSNRGTVFMMTPQGALTTLVSFDGSNGASPYAGLVQGNDGNFYGTTFIGGNYNAGTVFMMTPQGALTTLVSFDGADGFGPNANLVQGSDGNFYGTTNSGGSSDAGTVFMMTPQGALTTLVSFDGSNGASPPTSLAQGRDGNFYSTTIGGGSGNAGTVFMMTPQGALTTLVSFDGSNGAQPYGNLVQGRDGNFYGTTNSGGNGADGTVFMMTPQGALTTLVSFDGSNGGGPYAGLVQGSDGNFYGTTSYGSSGDAGTVFAITSQGTLTTLLSFDGPNGAQPVASLIQGRDGNFYGMTNSGGVTTNAGVIFQLIVPLTQVAAPVFSPGGGTYSSAQAVTIISGTSGASIRYTIDGSTPSETNGTIYSGPVYISSTATLRAIAFASSFTDSLVTGATYTINPPPTLNFEAEGLNYTSSGATTSVQTDSHSSSDKWVELASHDNDGDHIDFAMPNIPAGTYQLKMKWKGNNNRGILQLSVDGAKLGAKLDQYASGQIYPTTTFGNVTFNTTGNHIIRLTVTGKNKSSSGELLSADKFTLVGQ